MQKLLLVTVSAIALGVSATAALASGSVTYATQEGTDQSATIDQTGATNGAVGTWATPFDQNNGTGSGGNAILITQTGANNSFGVSAQSFQSGTTNGAIIDQYGNSSSVVLQQTGTNNGAAMLGFTNGDYNNPGTAAWYNSPSGGIIAQDTTSTLSNVFLSQNGSSNTFDIGQGGYNNSVNATQVGTNELYIRQGTIAFPVWYTPLTSSGWESNSTITVYQNGGGTSQYSYVGGTLASSVNYAALAQGGGDSNSITITQVGYANSADVNQNGSSNLFSSVQTGWGNFVGGENGWPNSSTYASLPITQTGTGNQYYNAQAGSNAVAMGSQTGTSNYVSNYQAGDSNTLNGSQYGYANQVYSSQLGSSNTLTYTQTGSSNYILNNQYGSDGQATVTQNGDSNQSYGSQDGAGPNTATVTQTGSFNVASYGQNGSGNSITIKQ